MSYPYAHDPYVNGQYPPQNIYSQQPYGQPPSPAAEYPPYTSTDYISPERDGGGVPGGRQTYPPQQQAGDAEWEDKYAAGAYEKQAPVTRGSIAAQLAAEGQIPKKEGLRMFRKDEHAGALTRGGRARCCGRVLCCSIMLIILILVGIVAAFFLWVRPPDVNFQGIEGPSSGSEVSVASGGFNLNFRLKINVINPNFFGADFNSIDATAYYPTKPTSAIGGGSLTNVLIKKNSNSTVHFPFSINYTTSYDPNLSVLKDIATKCGFLGGQKSQLTVNYKVKTSVKVIAVTISPSFSSSASFDCPLNESDISGFLGGSLSSLLNGSGLTRRSPSPFASREDEERAVRLATRYALMKLVERAAEQQVEEVGQVFEPARRFRVGTVRPA
ncbi:hypothetical protein JCM10295v2_001768 [Rhodotorula toruloides]